MGLTRLTTAAAPALHKAVDARRLSVTAALTYPVTDRAGDWVNPAGGDWTVHKAAPWVGYEHLRWNTARDAWVRPEAADATAAPVVVGTARDPDTGRHAVEMKSVDVGGGAATLPFGTTFFDPDSRLQSQMFRLVEDDTLPAVSLEFTPKTGQFRELGPSPLEGRPAYHVDGWSGLGWVHCAEPVNPGALTLRKALTPAQERVVRLLETKKVGGEAAHPLILKSLARFAPGKSSAVVSGFGRLEKAMPDATDALQPAYAPGGETRDAAAAPPRNGVEAFYDHAQRLLDQIAELEADMEASDSPELIDAAGKIGPLLEAVAERLKDHADKHDAKLQAKRGGKEPPAEDDSGADMEVDDAGVLKAMRPCFYKAIREARVRRFSKAEVAAAPAVTPADAPEDVAAADRELEAARRKLDRAKRIAG